MRNKVFAAFIEPMKYMNLYILFINSELLIYNLISTNGQFKLLYI